MKQRPTENSSRNHVQIANDYALGVVGGAIPAGSLVRKACQRQIDDLAKQDRADWPYFFSEERANYVCEFIECLPHTKGKWAQNNELLILGAWQCFLVTTLFGWLRRDNKKRRFRSCYWEIPRKNGKSPLAAAIGNYMLLADGEFGAEVYAGATTEKQAWEVFRPAQLMLSRQPALRRALGADVCARAIIRSRDASKFEPVIGNPGDGSSPSCAIVDEYHEHDTSALLDTMETGMGAREHPLLLVITTAGYNVAGPCHEKRDELVKVLDGVIENEQLFGCVFSIDSDNHDILAQSSYAIKRMGEICKCKYAHVEKTCQYWLKDYAAVAMTNSGEKTASLVQSDVKTIRIDTSSIKDYAAHAMSSNYLTPIQPIKSDSLKKEPNGQSGIENEPQPQELDGLGSLSPESTGNIQGSCDLPNTDLISLTTNAVMRSRAGGALSAEESRRLYASITATIPEKLGDYSVDSAILQLAILETARAVYSGHSDICEVKHRICQNKDNKWVITEPPDDWADPRSLIKANPNYNVSVDADFLLSQQRQAMANTIQQNRFKTKHLNVWCAALHGWMNMQLWALAADSLLEEEELAGEDCWIGVDLASKSDLCAESKLYRKMLGGKPHYYLFNRYWLPEAAIEEPGANHGHYQKWVKQGLLTQTDGATVDFGLITEQIIDDAKRLNPQEVIYDPFNATQMAQSLMEAGIKNVVEFKQTPSAFAIPMDEIEAALKDGRFHHDGNQMTGWCFSNVVARPVKKGMFSPSKAKREQKIDGAISAMMTVARAVALDNSRPPQYQMIVL